MNCWNCGFRNEPDDEFCGNCGKYLKFSGTDEDASAASDSEQGSGDAAGFAGAGAAAGGAAAGGAAAASGASGTSGAGAAGSASPGSGSGGGPTGPDDPTSVFAAPGDGGPGTGATRSGFGAAGSGGWGGGQPGGVGRSPDIICWNCGRRNPASRTFCINCGQKLTTPDEAGAGFAGAGAGGAGGAYAGSRGRGRDEGGGGGGGRTAAVILGALALLFILGVVGALALGLFGSRPPPVGVITPTPAGSAAGSPSLIPGTAGPSGSVAFPSVEVTAPVFTLGPTIPPTPAPTKTPRPTCDATGAPRGCRPSPTPEPATPTPVPTPVNCSTATVPTKTITMSATDNTAFPSRTVPANRVWCVHGVTFTNTSVPGATGTLKLFIENDEFIGPPGNYGMARIGWPGPCEAIIESDFEGSTEHHPECEYPFGYEFMPSGTVVSFEIVECGTNGTCSGSVSIEFQSVIKPPAP